MVSENTTKGRSLLREPLARPLILGLLFALALCLRVYGITQPPMEFFQVRQYHGALLARGFYEWLLTGSLKTIPPDGIIEPPVLELLASFAYAISGGEHLWIPRLLSTLFWMAGGIFVYLTARKIASPNAAICSVAFYLFVPYSVFASRAFMPDPLMIMLLVIGIFAILRYHEQPSTNGLIVAAATSSLAIFVKPGICLFQLFGAFVSLAVYRQGIRRALIGRHFVVFATLSVLPSGLYYLYGTTLAGFLEGQSSSRKIIPQLVLQPSFWEGWGIAVWLVMGFVALVVSLLGALLSSKGFPRALLFGLWGGYLLFGLTFTFHVHTHSYYSLQLIPVVALSLAPLCALVTKYLRQIGVRSYKGMVVLGVTLSVVMLGIAEHRQEINQIALQNRMWLPYASSIRTYQEIGEVVDHNYRTLVLFSYSRAGDTYGYALMYHGRLLGHEWPRPIQRVWQSRQGRREVSTQARFQKYSREYSPEYFIVSRVWWQAQEAEDLQRLLTENFSSTASDANYVVFDLTESP